MEFEIRNPAGERLDHTFTPSERGSDDLVVIGHGVTANKDRPFLVALAEALAQRGIASLRFSFSGNGDSEGSFEQSTITKEVVDLGAVLDVVCERGFRVGYAGHSMGAAVGVIRAASDERIVALASLAGMVHTQDFVQRKFGDQVPGRSLMWDKPECPLSQAYVDDLTSIRSVAMLGARIKVPWILVHGDADTVVPLQDARDIHTAAGAKPTLLEIDGVDHVFSGDGALRMAEPVAAFFADSFAAN